MSEDDIRVGVFVCNCGSNIGGIVNVPEVVEYTKGLKNVVFADESKWSCSVDALAQLQNSIKEHNINRVVIAACTPRTHEPLFKRTVKAVGLNPYLLEFVSIREQSSWVHMNNPQVAAEKAKDLIKMGVAKAAFLEEGEEIKLPVKTDCLVIGGGVAGMTAAQNLAIQGFNVTVVEREAKLGGLLNRVGEISSDDREIPSQEIIKAKMEQLAKYPNIKVYTNTTIKDVSGYIGNYKVTVQSNGTEETFDASTVIVATGMQEVEPVGQFCYGENPRVVTQLQLEDLLKQNTLDNIEHIVMINCVNSMNETRGCCNIGCHVSIKNALALRERFAHAKIYILFRTLCLVKEERRIVERAKDAGIKFIRFPDDRYPEVQSENNHLLVKVYDTLLGREFRMPADLLVLTTAFEGDKSVDEVKGQLKVSSNAEGFFQEAHIKLGPLDFPADGLFLCGGARSPKNVKDTTEEALGAAMRASIPMKRGYIEADGIVADINLAECSGCGICVDNCPYGAIKWAAEKEPVVIKALCKGCGLCAADCPKNTISIVHFSDRQLLAMVEAALEENPSQKIIGFICHWCCHGAVDMAGVGRMQYPPNVRLIRVMCSARVSAKHVLRAFELGAAGVFVGGCEFPTCHYIVGNYKAEKRMDRVKKNMPKKGFDPEKLWVGWCSAADGPKFANIMRDMAKKLNLG
ncbi:MAG: hydrogenase iron-sulfur subunit [Proteobacteria bacterium]|nr:hydrogenase iron-sulfur subunit [Pseudomonadota bacterium]